VEVAKLKGCVVVGFFFPGCGVELADCGVELVDCGVALADCGVDSKASPLGVEVSTSREFL